MAATGSSMQHPSSALWCSSTALKHPLLQQLLLYNYWIIIIINMPRPKNRREWHQTRSDYTAAGKNIYRRAIYYKREREREREKYITVGSIYMLLSPSFSLYIYIRRFIPSCTCIQHGHIGLPARCIIRLVRLAGQCMRRAGGGVGRPSGRGPNSRRTWRKKLE